MVARRPGDTSDGGVWPGKRHLHEKRFCHCRSAEAELDALAVSGVCIQSPVRGVLGLQRAPILCGSGGSKSVPGKAVLGAQGSMACGHLGWLHIKTLLIAVTKSQAKGNGAALWWFHPLVLSLPETVHADGKCLAGAQQLLTGWHHGKPKS